ncbi:MAG: cytochrome c4 [Burkholderiaceae bacterium]|jgi:cytochrome c553|nr:cytochrome c4 [Burkholderiaceae bacterium]
MKMAISKTSLAALLAASSIVWGIPVAFAQQAAVQPDPEKGSASFATVCIACHGPDGNSNAALPTQPKLAQQHPAYLIKQLREFRSGVRENAIMKPFADMLTEEDLVNIPAWLTTQKAAPGEAKNAQTVFLGEQIYRGGIMDRNVPACAGCHGPNGSGIPAQYPRVAGQFPEYTEAQLLTFRDGVRKNNDVMAQVAAKMNDREIKAVADYIAGLR